MAFAKKKKKKKKKTTESNVKNLIFYGHADQ